MTYPKEIINGWPPKKFYFTGEFETVIVGGRRAAKRNRKTVSAPVYRAEDDQRILFMDCATQLNEKPTRINHAKV